MAIVKSTGSRLLRTTDRNDHVTKPYHNSEQVYEPRREPNPMVTNLHSQRIKHIQQFTTACLLNTIHLTVWFPVGSDVSRWFIDQSV